MHVRDVLGRPDPVPAPAPALAPLAWLRRTGALRNARLGLAAHRLTAPLAFRSDRADPRAAPADRG